MNPDVDMVSPLSLLTRALLSAPLGLKASIRLRNSNTFLFNRDKESKTACRDADSSQNFVPEVIKEVWECIVEYCSRIDHPSAKEGKGNDFGRR